ncbi:MAG: hypothetical protein K2I69_09130 [Muribaculaceae bacterium]|nr:hypothetical protein [Muribaculaceae bacterium]MDE6573990.1 hypothetical protein [Muribaculaceae bacterium]
MKPETDREKIETHRITVQIRCGVIIFILGILLVLAGFAAPPLGVIDSSVLIALGEILTFSGALLGVAIPKRD